MCMWRDRYDVIKACQQRTKNGNREGCTSFTFYIVLRMVMASMVYIAEGCVQPNRVLGIFTKVPCPPIQRQ